MTQICNSSAAAVAWQQLGILAHLRLESEIGNNTASGVHDAEGDRLTELVAAWEDKLDLLGSEPDMASLRRLIEYAPDRSSELYAYAKRHYLSRLSDAMQDWQDQLDAMGAWAETEALETILASCPNPQDPAAIYLAGVISQRVLFSVN